MMAAPDSLGGPILTLCIQWCFFSQKYPFLPGLNWTNVSGYAFFKHIFWGGVSTSPNFNYRWMENRRLLTIGGVSPVFPWEMLLQDCPVPGALCRHTTHDAFDDGQVWEAWRWNSNGDVAGLWDTLHAAQKVRRLSWDDLQHCCWWRFDEIYYILKIYCIVTFMYTHIDFAK